MKNDLLMHLIIELSEYQRNDASHNVYHIRVRLRRELRRQDGGGSGSGSGSGSVAVVAVTVAQSLEGRGCDVR